MFTREHTAAVGWPRCSAALRRRVSHGADCWNVIQHPAKREASRRCDPNPWRRWRAQAAETPCSAGMPAAGGEGGFTSTDRSPVRLSTGRLVSWITGIAVVAVVTMVAAYHVVGSGGMEAYGYSATILREVATSFH